MTIHDLIADLIDAESFAVEGAEVKLASSSSGFPWPIAWESQRQISSVRVSDDHKTVWISTEKE